MEKSKVYQEELEKLHKLFELCDPSTAQMAEGLMQQAAFLYVENAELQEKIMQVGMVRFHPQRPELQKPTEAAKQFLKNAGTYALLIGKLERLRTKNDDMDDDEELGDYE